MFGPCYPHNNGQSVYLYFRLITILAINAYLANLEIVASKTLYHLENIDNGSGIRVNQLKTNERI
jgi:hypothetical protein